MARFRSMHLFAGACGDLIASEMAGGEPIFGANHWTEAVATADSNFGHVDYAIGDLAVMDFKKLGLRGKVEILFASPECLPAGTTVLTGRGVIPIEDVRVGDVALTHKGRWRPVIRTQSRIADTVTVKGGGHYGFEVTPNHRFWARKDGKRWENAERRYRRDLADPDWTPAEQLPGHWWGTPISVPALEVPAVPGRGMQFTTGFWWLVGRWLGDGSLRLTDGGVRAGRYVRPRGEVLITCGHHETAAVRSNLKAWAPEGTGRRRDATAWW